MQLFTEMQSRFAEQMKGASPDVWRNFMGLQMPAMQGMPDMSAAAGNYQAQSQQFFQQMQEQMQKQTEQMLAAFGMKRP